MRSHTNLRLTNTLIIQFDSTLRLRFIIILRIMTSFIKRRQSKTKKGIIKKKKKTKVTQMNPLDQFDNSTFKVHMTYIHIKVYSSIRMTIIRMELMSFSS